MSKASADFEYPSPPFDSPAQRPPGLIGEMKPRPDHGEETYVGTGRLAGKRAIITGGDSGIGRAVAIAYAREGAEILVSYLSEDEDARSLQFLLQMEGRECRLFPGDIADRAVCRAIVEKARSEMGGVDILVNNAAHQSYHEDVEDLTEDEWDRTFQVNVSAMFYLTRAAVPLMKNGGSIINTSSVNLDTPRAELLAYAATKAAIQNFTGGLAQLLAPKGIRVNAVAPGPVWTPLIPATMPQDFVKSFGEQVPMGRPAQPAELAPVYVMLASREASYISGATIAVTGGKPII
jgi:NAD(P)-dependent dehydrogenase (short-subunit alcohol dehydrogenase family)